nr:hypothetical protein [Tanacetum cinerariifolium]
MANENVPTPFPTRSDDQILPFAAWVPIGKSNFILDLQKKQKNLIFQIFVDILQNTNFFRAFNASASLGYPGEIHFVPRMAAQISNSSNAVGSTKKGKKTKPHVILYSRFTKLFIYHLKRHHNIHQRSRSPLNFAEDDLSLGNLKFVPKGKIDKHERKIAAEKEIGKKKTTPKTDKPMKPTPAKQAKPTPAKQPKPKPIKEKSTKQKPTPTQKARKGEEYDLERAIQMSLESFQAQGQTLATEEASTGPSVQPQDDISANIVYETPSPADAKTGTDINKVINEGDIEILNINEEQEEDVDIQVYLEEQTAELDEGQAVSDLGNTLESRTLPDDDKMDEGQAGLDPGKSHVALAGPNLDPMHDDFMGTVYLKEFVHHSKQPVKDMPIPDDADDLARSYKDPEENKLLSKTGDMGSFIKWFYKRIRKKKLRKYDLEGPAFKVVKAFHENNISLQFQMEECHRLLIDQVDLVNPEVHRLVPDVSKPLPLEGPLGQVTIQPQFFFNKDLEYLISGDIVRTAALLISKLKAANYPEFGLEELLLLLWIESERDYNISAAYGIIHWWFKRKEFYITRHSALFDCHAVRSHMRILSVISIKTFEKIRLRLSERDVYTQRRLQRTKLNLTEPIWDALEFIFKEYYTIVSKPRAVIYKDRNDQKKMPMENEVHKFSDGTLTRVLHKVDHMVKDFRLYQYNSRMNNRIWSEDDKRRSEEFMEVIERRLKIWRILQILESFVGGRFRDFDYRTLNRTE